MNNFSAIKKMSAWRKKLMLALSGPSRVRLEMILSSLAINILVLSMPIMTLQVYDRVITHKGSGTMLMLTLGIIAAVAIDTALRLARAYVTDEGSAAFEYGRSEQLMRQTVGAWADEADRLSVGDYVQAMGAAARMKEYAAMRMIAMAVDGPFFLLFIGVITYIGGWLVMAPLLLMGGFGYAIWRTGQQLLSALGRTDTMDTARYSFVLEALTGIHTIKALGVESVFARRFRMMLGRSSGVAARVALLNQRLAAFGALFAQSVVIVVVVCGAPMVIGGSLSLGGLIACVLLSGRLIQPLQHALMLWVHHQEYRFALQRIGRMARLQQQHCQPLPLEAPQGAVECVEVIYAKDVTAPMLLDHLNLSIKPGEAIAMRGKEGAGRGSFLKLLAGVMKPSHGSVRVDGIDPALLDGESLVRRVAYLPTESVLLRGTVMENLTGFNPEWEPRAREIAQLLGLDPLIVRLPQGYDTPLEGGHSEMIPPGFCQRIAIARALRAKPKLILFDRADRSLDRDGYQHVFDLLARVKGRATLVMVSDDENLIRLCDRVVTLEEGRLIPERTERPYLSLYSNLDGVAL